MRAISRRAFLEMGVGAAAGPLSVARARAAQPSRPSFPYVDGLSFLGENPSDVASSGLSAFISDVSAGEQIKQPDGSSRFVRSFDACARAITDQRRRLEAGSIPGAFLATKGSQIAEAHRTGRTAVFFQFQGCEPIGEALWRLDLFHALGLRVLQITHHHDNAWGGGAIEKHWSGLSTVGRAGVERLNALGIIPDLSHGSDLTALDVLRVSRRPVVVSHGAARAIVNNARCTSDAVIRGVARSGGMMGIFMMTFWLTNDPVPTVDAYIAQIRHVINVGGLDAVGIANDYPLAGETAAAAAGNDNATVIANYFPWWDSIAKQGVLGFDRRPTHVVFPELNNVRRMFLIHQALDRARFGTTAIEQIMGGNWVRVLSTLT